MKGHRRDAAALTLGLALWGCVGSGGPPLAPVRLELAAGDGQTGVVGEALGGALIVQVKDELGRPSAGLAVTFVVTRGSAALNAPDGLTGDDGRAQTTVVLGTTPGPVEVEASLPAFPLAPVRFQLGNVAGAATFLVLVSGDGQRDLPGARLPAPLVVAVEDRFHNPAPGTRVSFAVTSGSATLTPTVAETGADGRASTVVTLPSSAGAVSIEAVALAVAGQSLTLTATAEARRQAQFLTVVSGSGQRVPIHTRAPLPLVAIARDAANLPMPRVLVAFAIVTGEATLSAATVLTGDDGLAQVRIDVGGRSGPLTFTASTDGALGSPVSFAVTALAGPSASLRYSGGDEQRGVVGTSLPRPLAVALADAFDNPVAGARVSFTVLQGEGTLAGPEALTGEDGVARLTLTLPRSVGVTTVRAWVEGLVGSPVDFRAVALAGPPLFLTLAAGGEQQGPVGATLALPLSVRVTDAFQNALSGVEVAFRIVEGSARVAAPRAVTGSDGLAATALQLGTTAGLSTLEASVDGLVGSPVVTHARALPGQAARLVLVSGDAQAGRLGTALAEPLTVALVDALGNGVENVFIEWVVTGGSASVGQRFILTGSDGLARAAVLLGATAGPIAVEARASNVSVLGSPVVFGARARLSESPTLRIVSGERQTGRPGNTLAPFVVSALDTEGQPSGGTRVAFALAGGTGSLSAGQATTDATGRAQVELTLGATGLHTVSASAIGFAGSPLYFVARARELASFGYVETLRNGMTVDTLSLAAVDVVLHAFLVPSAAGALTETLNFAAYRQAGLVARAHAAGKRIVFSLGGATGSAGFSALAASPSARAALIAAVVFRLADWGYDGVDLDWEFPQSAADRANLTRLVSELRTALRTANPRYLLCLGLSTGHALDYYDFPALGSVTDFAIYFAYDWNNPANGPLETPATFTTGGGTVLPASTKGAVDYIVAQGYPARNLLLGLPFYSSAPVRSWYDVRALWAAGTYALHTQYREAFIAGGWWTVPDAIVAKLDATLDATRTVLASGATLGGLAVWELGHEGGFTELSDAVAGWLAVH